MFDAHVHLDFLTSAAAIAEYVRRARGVGVSGFAIPGVSVAQWTSAERVAKDIGALWGCGIHPERAVHDGSATDIKALVHHAQNSSPDFVGETGLDARLEPDFCSDAQERLFVAHVELAETLGRPLVVHSVRRHARVLALLEGRRVRGMVHGFIGSPESAAPFWARGWMLSFGRGAMRSPKTQRTIAAAPLGQLLLESDEPSETSDVPELVQWVSELRGVAPRIVAEGTSENAQALLGSPRFFC